MNCLVSNEGQEFVNSVRRNISMDGSNSCQTVSVLQLKYMGEVSVILPRFVIDGRSRDLSHSSRTSNDGVD